MKPWIKSVNENYLIWGGGVKEGSEELVFLSSHVYTSV
jgi:hypothetical protein